jgi:hypothetical protein
MATQNLHYSKQAIQRKHAAYSTVLAEDNIFCGKNYILSLSLLLGPFSLKDFADFSLRIYNVRMNFSVSTKMFWKDSFRNRPIPGIFPLPLVF